VDADPAAGLEVARAALRVEGDVRVDGPARVVELLPEPNMAAGPAEHSLAELLGTESDGGRLVIVLRDAHRNDWARAETERLVAAHPDAIVVETGLPYWRPAGARAYMATHGAGRANLQAATDRLHGAFPRP
jgi:beta-N-acetylhexosaminidase